MFVDSVSVGSLLHPERGHDFCVCCCRDAELGFIVRVIATGTEEIVLSGEDDVMVSSALAMPVSALPRQETETFNSDDSDPSPKTQPKRNMKRSEKIEDVWDVFLSYRVNADRKLVEVIYWRLIGCDIVVNGVSRKLRVFWDAECLLSGESWETGFCRALCSSTLVILVISREAFQGVATLTADSPPDNLILEFELALWLVIPSLQISLSFEMIVLIIPGP